MMAMDASMHSWTLVICLLVGYSVYILYTNSSIDMMYNIV